MGRRRAPRALRSALAAALAAAALDAGAAAAQAPAAVALQPAAAASASDAAAAALALGDAEYARRHEGGDDYGRARPEPIAAAVAAYGEAIAAEPGAIAPRWRLVRAIYFEGDYAAPTPADAGRALDRAISESEQAKDVLAEDLGGRDVLDALEPDALRAALAPEELADVGALYFWSAVAWAAWGREHGLLAAVREGLAGRVYRDAQVALALDEGIEEGGAHRMLARLHATLPRVPFLAPWVDRAQALPELERALALAPDHPGNRLLYALTLLELAPERRAEALDLLEEVAAFEPRAGERSEDLAMRKSARERLSEERARGV